MKSFETSGIFVQEMILVALFFLILVEIRLLCIQHSRKRKAEVMAVNFLLLIASYGILTDLLSDYLAKRKQQYDRLIDTMGKNCALFFLSDMLAIEAMGYFRKKGLRIPEDVSVAGYDDIAVSHMMMPALTTVRQNIEQKAELAGQMLLDILEGKQVKDPVVMLPVNLCIRDSVRRPEK